MSMANEQINNDNASQLAERQILILYGSEAGNSQDTAEELERLAERLHFKTRLEEMNDVELGTLLEYPLVIFVISTTGQGEVPSNARTFWKSLLRKRLPPTCLGRLTFTTFGLGDSSYIQYNWAARKLHKRLEQLGATEFYPRGEADERHDEGTDGAFLPWSISLRTHLLTAYPLPEGLQPLPPEAELPPKLILKLSATMDDQTDNKSYPKPPDNSDLDKTAAAFSHIDLKEPWREAAELTGERFSDRHLVIHARQTDATAAEAARWIPGGFDTVDRPNGLRDHAAKYSLEETDAADEESPPEGLLPVPSGWEATVAINERVTPDEHWQDVRALVLLAHEDEGSTPPIPTYNPGDCVEIYPKNFPDDVQMLIDRMEWGDVADQPVTHWSERWQGPVLFPSRLYPLKNSTLRQLLIHNYDITAIPRRRFFEEIQRFAKDPMQKERLSEFSNPAFTDEFYDYTSRPRRSILEILHDFSSVMIPYYYVPTIFPKIRPREYSISSGGFLMDEPNNPRVRPIEILVALVKYKTVLRKTRKGLCSHYIESLKQGTKISITIKTHKNPKYEEKQPVLAIATGTGVAPIRAVFYDRQRNAVPGGQVDVLFFGCRDSRMDYYYEDDWSELSVRVVCAFSRDPHESKRYVQDVIREKGDSVCNLVQQGAIILICGSAGKMPEAVRAALCDVFVEHGIAADEAGANRVLQEQGRVWEEVW